MLTLCLYIVYSFRGVCRGDSATFSPKTECVSDRDGLESNDPFKMDALQIPTHRMG